MWGRWIKYQFIALSTPIAAQSMTSNLSLILCPLVSRLILKEGKMEKPQALKTCQKMNLIQFRNLLHALRIAPSDSGTLLIPQGLLRMIKWTNSWLGMPIARICRKWSMSQTWTQETPKITRKTLKVSLSSSKSAPWRWTRMGPPKLTWTFSQASRES
jgi:hypothetical protein